MNYRKALIYMGYGLFGLIFFSLMATIIFSVWYGFDLDQIRPWHWYEYFRFYAPDPAYHLALAISGGVPTILIAMCLLGPVYRPKKVFGDARWSTRSDRDKADLHAKTGVLLGRAGASYICSDTKTHTLLCGPTRAGKGTGIVIPNCLNWPGSLVVLDVKTENHRITSGFRKAHGHATFLWSPMAKDSRSHRYNPLDMVSPHPAHRVTDVQNMATMLVDVSDKDPMWGLEARALFVGLTLFVLETAKVKSLGEVYRWLCSPGDLRDTCENLLKQHSQLSQTCIQNLNSFVSKNPKESASVRSNLISALRLFENPMVDAATEISDFSIRDLRRKRMAIYVGAMASQLDTLAPLLRLFFQQCMAVMSEKEPGNDEPHKVLMLLDEFVSLGKMEAIVSAFTLLAGYNVRVLAVIQGLSWLDNNYGRDTREGLISCCGNQIFMTTNDETTTAYVSGALGDKTVTTQSVSRRTMTFTHANSAPSRNLSTTGRPLMSKQEVRKMDAKKQIILTEGHRPTLARKIVYFKDKHFTARLMDPAAVPELNVDPSRNILPSIDKSDTIIDDGGPIVFFSDDESNGGADFGDGQKVDDPDAPLSVEQQELFDLLKAQLVGVLQAEATANPQFAAAHSEHIKRIKDNELEDLMPA